MARFRKKQRLARVSHDSMLDIVTNALGLLILVATLTAFSSEGIRVTLGAPIMDDADENKELLQFEVRDGGLYPIEMEFIEGELLDFFGSEYSAQIEIAESFNLRRVETDYYRFEMEPEEKGLMAFSGSYVLTPLENAIADRVADLEDPESDIRLRLDLLDPDETWLFFLVRADSFDEFRKFRDYLIAKGYEVGWSPVEGDDPLKFGPGGRSPQRG